MLGLGLNKTAACPISLCIQVESGAIFSVWCCGSPRTKLEWRRYWMFGIWMCIEQISRRRGKLGQQHKNRHFRATNPDKNSNVPQRNAIDESHPEESFFGFLQGSRHNRGRLFDPN